MHSILFFPHFNYLYGTKQHQQTAFIKHLLKIASKPNDIVFDPFMGVATTGEAALKNNRRFIGTDIDEKYVKASLERLSKY